MKISNKYKNYKHNETLNILIKLKYIIYFF